MTIVVDASVALRWCFQLNGSDRAEELLRSDDHLIAPDLVIAEITNAAWKFVTFDRMTAESAMSAVREVVKAFDELVPTSGLKDRALAIAIELRHPAYAVFIWLIRCLRSSRCGAASESRTAQPFHSHFGNASPAPCPKSSGDYGAKRLAHGLGIACNHGEVRAGGLIRNRSTLPQSRSVPRGM